jgi:hypothetical protein
VHHYYQRLQWVFLVATGQASLVSYQQVGGLVFYDKEEGLTVAEYLAARTLDARDLKDSIERTANGADTVYEVVNPYLATPPKKGP